MGMFIAGNAGLILFLYGVKAAALRHLRPALLAGVAFFGAVVLCVPLTWALSPDWHNPNVLRIAVYVGSPIACLAVPCASFLVDLACRSAGGPGEPSAAPPWRLPVELLIAVPAWIYLWVWVEVLVLGWVWI
jgi:hypothetical protein